MPGWAVYNTAWDWQAWLNTTLDQIVHDQAPSLIVDLRGNEGGLDCGDLILARLIDRDLTQESSQSFARYTKVPEHLNKYLDTWDDTFRDVSAYVEPAETPALVAQGGQQYYRQKGGQQAVTIAAKSPRYTGKVFVLVDAVCSSATFRFASIVKNERLGTLVGEPTGGNQRGINGGYFFFLRLPNSGIEMDVPLKANFPGTYVPDAGIEPDYFVPTTAESIRAGRDLVMEKVRELARKP
jgi:C-terminal processing protease CtpA/Prc